MLFSFGQENPSQSCKSADNLKKTNTEIQIFPSFKGEIYSSKTVSGLFKRNQDDIVYASYSSDEQVLDQESDLIPDLYEGGLKTWECSLDLADYISPSLVTNKTTIELGCGSALPGIKALKSGASQVDFQDFNEKVIKLVTFPNILINTCHIPDKDGDVHVEEMVRSDSLESKFYGGDWADLVEIIPAKTYDLILTSETIYTAKSIPRLLHLIDHILKDDGTVILAAKKMYFGCSGGLEVFKLIAFESGFKLERVKEFKNGVAREIVKMERA